MAKFKKAAEPVKVRLKKNDLVEVTTGKEQGKTGKVLKVFREKNQVLIEKVNMIKRHTRPSPTTRPGGDRGKGSADVRLQGEADLPQMRHRHPYPYDPDRRRQKSPGMSEMQGID